MNPSECMIKGFDPQKLAQKQLQQQDKIKEKNKRPIKRRNRTWKK